MARTSVWGKAMRAAVYQGRQQIAIDDVPEPELRQGTVKIAVDWCGICGTDLHEYLEGPIFVPTPEQPHPITGASMPVQLGHEFAGRVVEVGEGVTRAKVGDPVAVEPIINCGQCPECRRGDYHLCRKLGFIGLSGWGGGFAESAVVPEHLVHQLGQLPTDLGALVEPIAVSFHAVRLSRIGPGQTAVVFGAGPIGLAALKCLRAAGAGLVVVSEVAAARKEQARRAGADEVIDPREQDVVERVQELTDGAGADVAFEAAGIPATFQTAIRTVKRGGTVVNIAIWGHPVELNPNDLVLSEVNLVGSICYNRDHPATIRLMQDGRIDTGGLITKRIKLDQIVDEGFEELVRNKDQHVKILVQP
jgi:(R,R)-butanediol dehydrogenase / meso-butanediol dehydrogenase / diacetyl reductase